MSDAAVVPHPTRANARLSFSATIPNLQIAYDSVSLGAAKKCGRFYQLSVVEGWQGRGFSIHLQYGILYHHAMEFYAHRRADGMDHEAALRATLWDLAAACQVGGTDATFGWWNPSENLNEKAAADNSKTIPNLFRTVVWYLDQYQDDLCETVILANGRPAVELSFRYEIGMTMVSGEPAYHSGHIDRLVTFQGDRYVMDWKTSKNTINQSSSYGYFAQFNPNNQMTGYTLAGKIALGEPIKGIIINAAQIAKGFSRFERAFTMRTDSQLEEWVRDTHYWIKTIESWAVNGYWPMNDTSCSDYGGCAFRGICSKSPEVREIFLQSDFERRPWDPFTIRGDI